MIRLVAKAIAWYVAKRRGHIGVRACNVCEKPTTSLLCTECEEAFRHLPTAELARYVRSKK